MASQSQFIIDEGIKERSPAKKVGTRNQQNLRSSFPGSPMYTDQITTDERKSTYQNLILDGDPTRPSFGTSTGQTIPGGEGLGIDKFNSDYLPNWDVHFDGGLVSENEMTADGKKFGAGEGAPTTPFIPPLTSPGEGSMNAAEQPAFDTSSGAAPPEAGVEFGSGKSSDERSPTRSMKNISDQNILGSYISGRSYNGSGN